MKFNIKINWIKALRSKRYKQGSFKLRDIYKRYCPLGVLCDILDHNAWKKSFSNGKFIWSGYAFDCVTPVEAKLVGLTDDEQIEIMYLNDYKKLSFEEIANWIEKNVPIN